MSALKSIELELGVRVSEPGFALVTLVCTWPGSVGLSPAGASEWAVRIEQRAVDDFKKRAKKDWPEVRVEVKEEEKP